MQHGMQAICISLILCVLQFCKNKKLMQVQKMACRSGKNVVNLQSQLRIRNQESRQICYEDKNYNHNHIIGVLLLHQQDYYRKW